MACGWTTTGIVERLRADSVEAYRLALVRAGVRTAKADNMAAGFAHGFDSALGHLVNMGALEVRTMPEEAGPDGR